MDCAQTVFSGHAIQRIFMRALAQADILHVVRFGEVIEDYPQDTPFPSYLMLGFVHGSPLHVVVAKDDTSGMCIVVTAYIPRPDRWSADFRRKRP